MSGRLRLDNETKIRFCNGVNAMANHADECDQCAIYMTNGNGDLCEKGKDIIVDNLAYTDTKIHFSRTPPVKQ